MKKIILYIIIIMAMIFILPAILTLKFETIETVADEQNNQESKEEVKIYPEYNYKNFGTINMIDSKSNEISQISLDEYLLRSCFCRNAS